MDQKKPSFKIIINWLLAIVLINGALLIVFVGANPAMPFFETLWKYMESDVFTLVTGSLILPTLFTILDRRYKFMENIRQRREDRRKQLEEQRSRNRQETVKDTLNMWQELFDFTSEIIFFDPVMDDKKSLTPVYMKLNQFSSSAEHIVNKWTHQFPNLKPDDNDVLLYFINVLYHSGQSAIHYIIGEHNPQEVKTLQNALFQIQDQIKNIMNHTSADIFKFSTRYLEIKENNDEPENLGFFEKRIKNYLDLLRSWRDALKTLDENHDNFLSTAQGPQIDELRNTAKSIENWLNENKDKEVNQAPEFMTLQNQFYNIPIADRIAILRIPYTREYLFALADWLSFESACTYLYDRVHHKW